MSVVGVPEEAEMIERSPEIEQILRETMEAMERSDMDAIERHTSRDPGGEGGVGWAAGRGWFDVEGQRVAMRVTAVLHQEDGDWKTVQTHASIGVPDDRMFDPMLPRHGVS